MRLVSGLFRRLAGPARRDGLDALHWESNPGPCKRHSPDEVEQLRDAIWKASHELAEALTAADAYLAATEHLDRQIISEFQQPG